MSGHVLSIGDLVLDLILPVRLPVRAGEHQEPAFRRAEPGGAANFMIAAQHMGLRVSAAGTVGDDALGAQILEPLHAEGIDTQWVVRVPGSTSTLVVVLTDQQSGEHVFLGHYGEGPAVPYPDGLDEQIAQADVLFLQGYTLAEARVTPLAMRAVERAVACSVPVFLDAGPFLAFVPPDRVRWLVERATLLMATEDEIPLASGGLSGQAGCDALLVAGVSTLVIKQGARGCRVITPDWSEEVPGFVVPVVDTVAAGDCFDAAFIAGLLQGLDLWQCGRLANAMGAAAVQKVGGGRNAPTCAEVMAVVKQAGERLDFEC